MMNNDLFNVSVKGHVKIEDRTANKILLDKFNRIHPQNMARVIARALSHEPNSYIYRLALGNGSNTWASDGTVIVKPALDGTDGSTWETRLYNETYSEIVDGRSSLVGTDPGDSDANSGVRPGGGAVPADDPASDSVVSQEVGSKSNVTVTMYINGNEPTGQANTTSPIIGSDTTLEFNEIALYTSGSQARDSSGYSSVNVGNATSSDVSTLAINTSYNISMTVNGVTYSSTLITPSAGTGPSSTLTYGDICEGINTGSWIASGDVLNNYIYVYITDNSGGLYPSILNKQSYGYLNFSSLLTGSTSTVNLSCSSGVTSDFFNILSGGICGNVNFTVVNGLAAGVANDPLSPTNERERMLTMLTFPSIYKSAGNQIVITYTLTVSVNPSVSTIENEIPAA